tara:strand:- start:1198 stop:1584 length:387 start_codon:yes stop_codon:yes gene_type:complete
MDRSQILKAFNDHFMEFVQDIRHAFPADDDLATVEEALMSFRKANPRLILTVFKESVVGRYRGEVDKGDINFFISKDYQSDVKDSAKSAVILEKIDALREPIRQMPQDEQVKVIKYLQNLCKLCDLYN